MNTIEERASLAERFYAAFDDGTPEVLDAVLSPDVVDHDPMPGSPGGRDGLKGLLEVVASAFSDREHVLEIVEPLGDDGAVVVWVMTGTHTGDFLGVPATGKRIRFKGIDVFRVRDGRIVEQHHVEQLLQVLGQLNDQGGAA